MRKSIIVRENDLLKIKKNMVGSSNTASHNTVCVNEARPEVDEFELGQESDNPPLGGNYSHVNEVYNSSVRGDMDRIDYIDYVPHSNPREEGYTEDNITEFEPYYELMCYDIDGNIIFSGELTLNELFDYFPDRIIHMMSNKEGRKVSEAEWRIEDILSWDTKPNDINNVEEVNAIAKRIQPGGPSSYILTDGDIVSFPDHAQITSIEGMTPSKFVGLGNIRVGKGLAELSKEPNRLQLNVLKDFLRGEDEICLDIVKDSGRMYPECICSAIYNNAPIDRLINDIVYYFKDGIKPQGNMSYESKMKSKNLIKESQESKSISAAKKLVMQKLNYNEQEADNFIRIKLRNDLPILRTPQGGKFILGVTRMFCDGELRNANDIGNLNSTLKLVASDAHINEYDRNLNGMGYQELIQRFSKAMSTNLEAEKAEVNSMEFDTPSDYEIVRIDSFKQAEKYERYVSWCVTHDKNMFDSYTTNGINQFYFCLKNGFENVVKQVGENAPLDEYGLSMIAVSVNENGTLNTCTCRWNHDNGGDDSIMNSKEVSQVIGMNFFEVFKPNNKWKELLSNVMQCIANGENPRDVFDYVDDFKNRNGFVAVILNDRWNYINQDGRFLSDQWFDYCGNFINGFARVELNGKYNLINQEGRIISDQWFDYCGNFINGFGVVKLNDRWNYINQDGRFLSDQWFDFCRDFANGLAIVKLNNKFNYINQECMFLSDQWFDYCSDFANGLAIVELNGKNYRIDTNGNILTNEGKNCNKSVILNESQLSVIKEDMEIEVDSSDIDLSSFKKKNCLAPIWHEDGTLNSKIRIKLLDIADDFWKFVNLTWVKPNGIILTGSICNFNWSSYSDIDLHLIVDFDEIDEKTEFVQDYLNGKKNEWNNEHEELKILGYPVEVYVQDLGEMPKSGGIYDLEQDEWIKKPNIEDVKPIGLNKFSIKDKAATIMTIIDDMYDALNSTNDSYEIQQIGDDAKYLWKKIKNMRKQSLETTGESGNGNIVYKCMRRLGYLEKLWKLSTLVYDRTNSITEGKSKSEKIKYTVYINGKKDDNFSDMNWKRKPKVGKGFYCGGAVFKIEKVTDDSIYAIEENIGYDETNSINENVEYGDNIFTMAIERFGVTNDIRECGYILPNGMMLDFSGRHTLSKGTDSSHLAGRRAIDHRDISDVGWSIDGNTKNFDLSMEDFIKLGAIRTHVSRTYSSINLFKKPTQQQLDVISRIIRFANGCIDVEIGDGDESLSYAEYDGVKPSVVIAQLNRFFNEGISLMESKEVLNEYLEKDYNLPYSLYRNESIKKYITLLKEKSLLGEEFNADGSSNGNPYKKRWDAERKALKDFICNYGVLMQSKEDNKQGRLYKCLWDKTLSNLIGYNYCLAVQYDEINNKPKSTIYVRACDRFTPNIRRNLQYDSRGQDNQIRANF